MANYYSSCTADRVVKGTKGECDKLKALLEASEDNGDDYHGFDVTFQPDKDDLDEIEPDTEGAIYLYAEESADPDALSDQFRKELGVLVAKEGNEFLQFGIAFTCTKMRPNSHGGEYFRIHADGRLVYPEIKWPES